jgi:hypothetical protein
MIVNGTLYELGKLDFPDLSSLQDTFDNLPADTYAPERLRSRRYSCFRYTPEGRLQRLSHKEFMQSKALNKAVGDVERKFEPIEPELENNIIFLKMFEEFQARTNLSFDSIIEAHQIRWHCRARVKEPAPEGMHQDGFDFIGMFMVSTENVDGGDLMVFEGKDEPPCFKKRLVDGEFLVMNDKKLFHNASPLVPTANKDDGHWDLIVLTANNAA